MDRSRNPPAASGRPHPATGRITAFPTAPPDGRPWTPEPPYRRIENRHRGKGLGVDGVSTADSTQVVQSTDNGTEDHEWRFV
ncbi:hypothetical protein SAM9427_34620 [Streptomyces sp. ETH9427]|nr:hypothetical protein SAM9427_34620 [Streptomyces sp. ETH9427]